jgi:outer membrane protein assembly factor BamB
MEDLIFVGTGRWIAALDKVTGHPLWRRKLPRWYASGPVTILVDEGLVYAGRGGYVYCLDALSGDVVWERGLASGSHPVLMATAQSFVDQSGTVAVASAQAAAARAAGA